MLSKKFTHSIFVFLFLFSLLGFTVQPVSAAEARQAACTQHHTVSRGENLFRIGQRYGVNWRELARFNNLANPRLIFAGQRLCVAWTGGPAPVIPATGAIPTITIVSVDRNTSVTVRTANYPANDTFRVLMGRFGTRGVGGIQAATFQSGAGGTQTATFPIPAALQGSRRIAIRLESPTSGFFSFNWFWNATAGTGTGGPVPQPSPIVGIPTFSIVSVARNNSVTIQTNNFPPNDRFNVLMNVIGTRGVGGILVDTINSGAGGSFTATFQIPAGLHGLGRIAIRLQSPSSGYFAYNWFYNR